MLVAPRRQDCRETRFQITVFHPTRPKHATLNPTLPSATAPAKPVAASRPSCISSRRYSQTASSARIKTWDFEEIQKIVKEPKNMVIVDVREASELQETGRIPGAIHIPITTQPDSFHVTDEEFEDRLGYPRPDKDTELLTYCRSGVRAHAAAEIARAAGWTKLGEYPGSWLDWTKKGGAVQK
ncbi:hypothetical protein P8C59_001288 [Phyllachora maydis]|uniref:Rhodanese domain-containing protein n=1 Tax=Phyllachora maydis TaxID=1825666 RepID=A0AAD9HZ37_9PEZI|nr:hypothetical protein P8C59_001288 [Phyllachora maydis]